MKVNYKKCVLFLFILFIFNKLSAQTETVWQNNYFPLNENEISLYTSNIGEAIKSTEKKDSLFLVTNKTSNFIYTQSLIVKHDGIYLLKTEQKVDILFFSKDINILYSEPVLQLPNPATVGLKWEWNGFQVKNDDTTLVYLTGEILDNEVVEVPAGKFSTIKIKIDFNEKNGEHTIVYKWLAQGIGNVKSKVIIDGSGVLQFAMSLLGYDEIDSKLIEKREKK